MKARLAWGSRRWAAPTAVVLAASALALSCFAPAEERAERDAEVGRASGAGLEVRVHGGLAAVRGISQERVHLWESAPSIVVGLESDEAPRSLELFVENCMPFAV